MATNRNIQMNYYNGTDYDTLYPQANYQNMTGTKPSYSYSELTGTKPSYSYSEITGTIPSSDLPTIPLTKGGTGQTTATNGLGALVYGSTTTSSLSTSYYVGLSTDSSGRKATLATLGSWIQSNYGSSGGMDYEIYSWTGSSGELNTYTLSISSKPGKSPFLCYLTYLRSPQDISEETDGTLYIPQFYILSTSTTYRDQPLIYLWWSSNGEVSNMSDLRKVYLTNSTTISFNGFCNLRNTKYVCMVFYA